MPNVNEELEALVKDVAIPKEEGDAAAETDAPEELVPNMEEAAVQTEEPVSAENVQKPEERPKIAQAALGLLILLMAILGVAFIVTNTVEYVSKQLNDDTKLREFDTFLTPVVMQDPKPFVSIDKAENEFLLEASIWKALQDDAKISSYEMDEDSRILLPVEVVEENAKSLFGNAAITHESFGEEDEMFTYNEETEQYHVPLISLEAFKPYTFSAKKKKDVYTLKVGYVPWLEYKTEKSGEDGQPTPSKTMEYILREKDGGYEIMSIAMWEE